MDPPDPAGGEDGPQRHPGPQSDGLSDRVRGARHAAGQVPAERRYVAAQHTRRSKLGDTVRHLSLWLLPDTKLAPLATLLLSLAGKEYVGIVRLHNAIENEHTLARVSVSARVPRLMSHSIVSSRAVSGSTGSDVQLCVWPHGL